MVTHVNTCPSTRKQEKERDAMQRFATFFSVVGGNQWCHINMCAHRLNVWDRSTAAGQCFLNWISVKTRFCFKCYDWHSTTWFGGSHLKSGHFSLGFTTRTLWAYPSDLLCAPPITSFLVWIPTMNFTNYEGPNYAGFPILLSLGANTLLTQCYFVLSLFSVPLQW
jgi:hypothetical protein